MGFQLLDPCTGNPALKKPRFPKGPGVASIYVALVIKHANLGYPKYMEVMPRKTIEVPSGRVKTAIENEMAIYSKFSHEKW